MHRSADYWIDQTERADEILRDPPGIESLKRKSFAEDPHMVDLTAYPDQMPGEDVADIIQSISKPYDIDHFYRDGGKLTDADYAHYKASLNLAAIPGIVAVHFALVLQRADMRTWPTEDVIFKSQETIELDRFQENGLFPAEVIIVLHESLDGLWSFVQSYNYAAWVRKDRIATGSRQEILQYQNSSRLLVVTGSKVVTESDSVSSSVSGLPLDMGVRVPLVEPIELSTSSAAQNAHPCHAVRLPVCNQKGELVFETALIAHDEDVHEGFLPFTRKNIIQQAFKFLGERYGWGHSCDARDCTGLVLEVYKTFGIFLPRNSEQQGHSPVGRNIHFSPQDTAEDRLRALAATHAGDLIYSPGHVMLYLGMVQDQPYVIHDSSGPGWENHPDTDHVGTPSGVSVAALRSIQMSREFTYFEKIYAIKTIG